MIFSRAQLVELVEATPERFRLPWFDLRFQRDSQSLSQVRQTLVERHPRLVRVCGKAGLEACLLSCLFLRVPIAARQMTVLTYLSEDIFRTGHAYIVLHGPDVQLDLRDSALAIAQDDIVIARDAAGRPGEDDAVRSRPENARLTHSRPFVASGA